MDAPLNPAPSRSCVPCYQRKLKCDRQLPCHRCIGRNVQCVYPGSKITRNRPKKPTVPTLREKVARLEKEVIGIKDVQSKVVNVYSIDVNSLRHGGSLYVTDDAGDRRLLSPIGSVKIEDEDDSSKRHRVHSPPLDLEANKPSVPFNMPMFSSMMGASSSQSMYRPTAEEFENFFILFCERVDPIVRILHKPTVRKLIDRIKLSQVSERNGDGNVTGAHTKRFLTAEKWPMFMPEKWPSSGISRPYDPILDFSEGSCSPVEYALLMSIADAATCSFTHDDPRLTEMFGETRAGLREKVGFATEVSLSRIKLASTMDLTALQVFILYVSTKILDNYNQEFWHTLWCPVALATRIANSIGLHLDGSTTGLPPFETEIRRRLWWHLAILNIRTSENYSSDMISTSGNSVKLPGNYDDSDLSPDLVLWPREREGPTEMSACLLRYEAIAAVADATKHDPVMTGKVEDKRTFGAKIQRFEVMINAKYLEPARAHPHNDRSRLVLALGQIAVLKLCWVWGFSLMQQSGQTPELSPATSNLSDELFITATKMLEQQSVLYTDPNLKNLNWILRNIKPWDGSAILLAQMKVRLQKLQEHSNTRCRFAELPRILKDAWNVSAKAFEVSKYWTVDPRMIEGLEKMRTQIGQMMGLPVEDAASLPKNVLPMQNDGFGALTTADEGPVLDTMDVDTFMMENVEQGAPVTMDDPWPMFIPMNFNYFGGGPF